MYKTRLEILTENLDAKQIQTFWSRVDIKDPDECWIWKGRIDHRGYGVYNKVKATRLAWFIAYGVLPEDNACHTCDVRACVNVKHLYDGSNLQNQQDSIERGRKPIGERVSNSKLIESQVREIKQIYRLPNPPSYSSIGKRYGVSGKLISNILEGLTWRHVQT
jgi:hypothetical protein